MQTERAILFNRSFHYTGGELRSLMRKHGVTIRELAARTGITMKRIREVRNGAGIAGCAACDWHEAITGSLTPRMRAAYLSAASR